MRKRNEHDGSIRDQDVTQNTTSAELDDDVSDYIETEE
jgi:hypothetical protein